MKPRDSASDKQALETREFANSLQLSPLLDAYTQQEKIGKEKTKELLESNNKKVKVSATFGDNNTGLMIQKPQSCVIVVSLMREYARNARHALDVLQAPWLAKEYRVERTGESGLFKNKDKQFYKTYPLDFNTKNESFNSISVMEHFPDTVQGRIKSLGDNNEARIDFTCQLGQQVCSMLSDLQKSDVIWSDFKAGNLLLRKDGTIGVSDFKAFFPANQALVRKYPAYDRRIIATNDDDFMKMKNLLKEDEFLVQVPDADQSIKFSVRNSKGELVEGSISKEELAAKFKDESEYNAFFDKISSSRLSAVDANKLYEIAAAQGKARAAAYAVEYIQISDSFVSSAFNKVRDKKYESPEIARESVNQTWQKEYSYQLAGLLYESMTGIKKFNREQYHAMGDDAPEFKKTITPDFDFNKEVFNSPDGQQMKTLISSLGSDDDFTQRMAIQDAAVILNNMQQKRGLESTPVKEVEAEVTEKPLRRSISRSISKKFLGSGLREKEEITPEKEIKIEPEITKPAETGMNRLRRSLSKKSLGTLREKQEVTPEVPKPETKIVKEVRITEKDSRERQQEKFSRLEKSEKLEKVMSKRSTISKKQTPEVPSEKPGFKK